MVLTSYIPLVEWFVMPFLQLTSTNSPMVTLFQHPSSNLVHFALRQHVFTTYLHVHPRPRYVARDLGMGPKRLEGSNAPP